MAYLGELSGRGVSRDRLLQPTDASSFTHYEFPGALTVVLTGEADVAVVPAFELESQELSGVVGKGRLTVIEGTEEPSQGCRRTSPVFPGVILATTRNISPIFLKAVTEAALSMRPSRGGDVWVSSTIFQGSSWICMKTTLEKTGFSDGQRSVKASV